MPNSGQKKNNSWNSLWSLIFLELLLISCSLTTPSQPAAVAPPPTTQTTSLPTSPTSTETIPNDPLEQPTLTIITQERVAVIPDPANYGWQLFAAGFDQPVYLTHAGDHSGRLFIVEKSGQIWIMENGQRSPLPFLDIRSIVSSEQSERGLLSLVFHQNYITNGFFFIYYTDIFGDTVTARYQVSDNPDIADPDSQKIIFQSEQPYANHNGGHLAFGPDGYLYISTGDGGSGGDPLGNGQNRLSFLGKILRINVDGQLPYEIPADNPFITFSSARGENWAYGLRNPWRFSFDRANGDLFIGDVGQNTWEEITLLPAGTPGGNLGWNHFEGNHSFKGDPNQREGLIFPILEYQHTGGHCSVTGGYVYRGKLLPEWNGVYLFGDYCSGVVWGALPDENGLWRAQQLYDLPVSLASFAEDQEGELYVVDLNGDIYQLTEN
jgi:glucose/arabinose dehydrogenase